MDSFFETLGKSLVILLVLTVLSTISGTIMWAAWDSIHDIFPTANGDLGIPKEIAWWTAVKFSFLCGTIWKTSTSTSSKKS